MATTASGRSSTGKLEWEVFVGGVCIGGMCVCLTRGCTRNVCMTDDAAHNAKGLDTLCKLGIAVLSTGTCPSKLVACGRGGEGYRKRDMEWLQAKSGLCRT